MPLGMEVGLSLADFVFDGDPAPSQKEGGAPPQFSADVYCGQTAVWIKMPLDTEVGIGPEDTVLDVNPAPPSPKRGQSPLPNFLAHVYCGQTAGWIKMALGVEVGLGPGHIVLDGESNIKRTVIGRALATPLATQFGPLTNSSGSKFAPLSPLQTQFGPLGTVHRPSSKFILVSKFSTHIDPFTPGTP